MKSLARRTLHALAHTEVGQRALISILRADPLIARNAVGPLLNRSPRFSNTELPETLDGLAGLAFLFSPNTFNYGIAALALDEAAYLSRLAANLEPGATIAEIGRYKGGCTFLLAASAAPGSHVFSYDLRVKLSAGYDYDELDRELLEALARYGLHERVTLLVADSRTAEPPPAPCNLLFVDGDHTYDGVCADFEHWHDYVAAGGHLIFHDAREVPFHTYEPGVGRLVEEIKRDGRGFTFVGDAGSLAHFVRH